MEFDLFFLQKILQNFSSVYNMHIVLMQFENASLKSQTFTWNIDTNKLCENTSVVFGSQYATRKPESMKWPWIMPWWSKNVMTTTFVADF